MRDEGSGRISAAVSPSSLPISRTRTNAKLYLRFSSGPIPDLSTDIADVKDTAFTAGFALHAEILADALRIADRDLIFAVRAHDICRAHLQPLQCHRRAPSCCDDCDDKTRDCANCSHRRQLESNMRQVARDIRGRKQQRPQMAAAVNLSGADSMNRTSVCDLEAAALPLS